MKRNTKAILISVGALILVAAALIFWVMAGTKEEKKEVSVKAEEAQEELLEQKKETEEEKNSVSEEVEEVQEEIPEEETAKEITMVFSGDILLSSYVLNNYENRGIDGVVSEELLREMQNADLTMVNEEFPFSARGTQAQDKQFTFRVDPSYVKILQEMGIDVVTLANNHALDYGTEALSDSFQTLDDAGIAYVGAGDSRERAAEAYITELGGKTFGFLAASRVIPEVSWNIDNQQPGMLCTYDSTALCEAIKKAKENCDYVAVYVHWGIERENMPQDYQRQLGKAYIDAGADIVIGSHPHVLQGIEYYNGKPIVYSLGNYIFNQSIEKTMLLKVTVSPENETMLQIIPASASGAKTQKMDADSSAELYQFMEEISFGVSVTEDGMIQGT